MVDHTLELLKKMREETQEGFRKIREETQGGFRKIEQSLGILPETLVSVQMELRDLKRDVGVLSIAVDAHTRRLDRIDERLGLDNPPPLKRK